MTWRSRYNFWATPAVASLMLRLFLGFNAWVLFNLVAGVFTTNFWPPPPSFFYNYKVLQIEEKMEPDWWSANQYIAVQAPPLIDRWSFFFLFQRQSSWVFSPVEADAQVVHGIAVQRSRRALDQVSANCWCGFSCFDHGLDKGGAHDATATPNCIFGLFGFDHSLKKKMMLNILIHALHSWLRAQSILPE